MTTLKLKTLEIAFSKCSEASVSNPLEKRNSPKAIEALANSESFSAANLQHKVPELYCQNKNQK